MQSIESNLWKKSGCRDARFEDDDDDDDDAVGVIDMEHMDIASLQNSNED